MSQLFELRDLVTRFDSDGATAHAVNGVSFGLRDALDPRSAL